MDNFLTIVSQIPGYIFWKDLNLAFQGGNQLFLKAAGFNHLEEIKNKTDYDMPWGKSHAELYRQRDNEVIAKQCVFEGKESQIQASGKMIHVFVKKSPLFDEQGNLIGVIGNYFEIGNQTHTLKNRLLPKRQAECLFYLVKGLPTKCIASEMTLSVRTVEHYITILKNKFVCRNKGELIAKTSGLFY